MRIVFVAVLAALAWGSATASAQTMMSDWSMAEMSGLLTEEGVSVLDMGQNSSGQPIIEAMAPNGRRITIFGTECQGAGQAQRCTGAEITTEFTLQGPAALAEAWRTLDFAAVSFVGMGDNRLRMTRYVIFDNGIARENLRVNIQVFIAIAGLVADRLGGAT